MHSIVAKLGLFASGPALAYYSNSNSRAWPMGHQKYIGLTHGDRDSIGWTHKNKQNKFDWVWVLRRYIARYTVPGTETGTDPYITRIDWSAIYQLTRTCFELSINELEIRLEMSTTTPNSSQVPTLLHVFDEKSRSEIQ